MDRLAVPHLRCVSDASQPQHELDEAVDFSEDNSSFPAFEGLLVILRKVVSLIRSRNEIT